MPSGTVVLMLALLLGLQPITTDLYLPALPAITEGFGAPISQAQLTLTALLLSFGLSQLLWGPLSDRFGRRPVLLIGLLGYAIAAGVSALASSMEVLILCRMAQGVAMGAGVMCARAIVRDLFNRVGHHCLRLCTAGGPALGPVQLAHRLVGASCFWCGGAGLHCT